MYNVHTYFSLKNSGKKGEHYTWQNTVIGGKSFQTAEPARAKALRGVTEACLRIMKEATVFTKQSEPGEGVRIKGME